VAPRFFDIAGGAAVVGTGSPAASVGRADRSETVTATVAPGRVAVWLRTPTRVVGTEP